MTDRVHQVGFAEANPPIKEERIVHPGRRLRDRDGLARIVAEVRENDRDALEPRLGSAQSKGCVRIPGSLARFLDHYGVLDAAYVQIDAVGLALRWPAAAAGVLLGLLLTFVGTQVSRGFADLSDQVVTGLEEIRRWLREGPLNASDSQINDVIKNTQDAVSASSEEIVRQVTEVGTALGHIVAGFFIVLFATYFFLADGSRIWAWVVRLFPRAARVRTDESGKVAWQSLTAFVRATVIIAFADAVGIVIVALILDVPFATAIGVLVFLGAFIPMVGATLSGSVAVLVALVAQGPVVALLMLGGVILVQQLEAHVLQPFLTGRFVSLHPLGIIVAIAMGVLLAGITGALLAVPLVAALNAVAQYLAGYTEVGEPVESAAEGDPAVDPGVDEEV